MKLNASNSDTKCKDLLDENISRTHKQLKISGLANHMSTSTLNQGLWEVLGIVLSNKC